MSTLEITDKALLLLSVVQGLFLAVLLWFRAPQRDGRMLVGLLLAFTLNSALDFIEQKAPNPGWLFPCSVAVILLLGPLALSYFEAVARPELSSFSRTLRWHWRVALAMAFALIASLVLWYSAWQDTANERATMGAIVAALAAVVVLGAAIVQQGLCLWTARRYLAEAKAAVQESSPRNARLAWLELLAGVLVVLWITFAVTLFGGLFLHWSEAVGDIGTLLYTAAIYGLGGFALLNPDAFRQPRESLEAVAESFSKYRKSALTPADVERLLTKLEQEMQRSQAWRDGSLSLAGLSKRIGASPNGVSQAINQGAGSGFYDYVNRYRIEEAKALLLDPAQAERTVLEIAYQVGFNSKSAFNTAFRKLTGTTPTSFRAGKTSSPTGSNDEAPLQLPS